MCDTIFLGPPPQVVKKGWGREEILVNHEYCAKYLHFNKGAKFSNHYHRSKRETFIVLSGSLIVRGTDLTNGSTFEIPAITGFIIEIPRFALHQIEALEDSVILEISTHHEDSDSYRVAPGDSQK